MYCQTNSYFTKSGRPYPNIPEKTTFRINVKIWENCLIQSKNPISEYFQVNTRINETERIFKDLASKWRRETRALSMMIHKTILNSTYRKIIDMGEKIVPYILKDLMNKPDHWFVALEEIYREQKINPVPQKDMGNIKKMAEAWISWGKANGKI